METRNGSRLHQRLIPPGINWPKECADYIIYSVEAQCTQSRIEAINLATESQTTVPFGKTDACALGIYGGGGMLYVSYGAAHKNGSVFVMMEVLNVS